MCLWSSARPWHMRKQDLWVNHLDFLVPDTRIRVKPELVRSIQASVSWMFYWRSDCSQWSLTLAFGKCWYVHTEVHAYIFEGPGVASRTFFTSQIPCLCSSSSWSCWHVLSFCCSITHNVSLAWMCYTSIRAFYPQLCFQRRETLCTAALTCECQVCTHCYIPKYKSFSFVWCWASICVVYSIHPPFGTEMNLTGIICH